MPSNVVYSCPLAIQKLESKAKGIANGLSFALLLSLAGCSGGGGGGDTSTPDPVQPPAGNEAPTASIVTPANNSMASSNQITVTGTANDADGVSSVTVNGIAASSDDAFANWSAVIDLAEGNNTIRVSATDVLGNKREPAAKGAVERGYLFDQARAIVADSANKRALMIDESKAAIMSVDSENQLRSVFSSADVGSGPNFETPRALLLDALNNRAVVYDSTKAALLSVDLSSGDRSIFADDNNGNGPALTELLLWSLDPGSRQAYALAASRLFTVDLDSGDRTTIPLSGPTITTPHSTRLDKLNNRLLVSAATTIYAIDLSNGRKTELLK